MTSITLSSKSIVWVAGFGLLLATWDTGIINSALPAAWHATAATAAWAVSAYTIPVAGTALLFGRAADRYGPERVLALRLPGFAAAAATRGAAPSLSWLLATRTAQGIASALLQATAAALAAVRLSRTHRAAAEHGALAMLEVVAARCELLGVPDATASEVLRSWPACLAT